MRRSPATLALLVAALLAAAGAAVASDAAWEALKRSGAVAVMRHAVAPGTGDPANFTLGDPSTQRNLDDRGRAQARAVGEAFRQRGIEVDRVMTSRWRRARETAELLGLGPVEDLPALDSFFEDRSTRDEQTRAVEAFLAGLPQGERLVLVTHAVNIRALTGAFASSGEIVVGRMTDAGFVVDGEILIRP